MSRGRQDPQRAALVDALASASPSTVRDALEGTVGDAQAFCWAALRQFERREAQVRLSEPRDFGLHHADLHTLLIVAQEAVAHVELIELVLDVLGEPSSLPPDADLRPRLREARNLLAEHRDERVLYWRLTGRHTPRVVNGYQRLGIELPSGTIDSEVLGYVPPPDASAEEIQAGLASVGSIGGLLVLPELRRELLLLSDALDRLASECAARRAAR